MQNQNNQLIDVAALQERMGNACLYVFFVLGEQSGGDNYRLSAIKTHGAEYLRGLWNSRFTLNQKYHIAMLAKLNMFTVRCAGSAFLYEQWDDMDEWARTVIVRDCQARIEQFFRTCADVEAARKMGLFDIQIDKPGGEELVRTGNPPFCLDTKEGVAA